MERTVSGALDEILGGQAPITSKRNSIDTPHRSSSTTSASRYRQKSGKALLRSGDHHPAGRDEWMNVERTKSAGTIEKPPRAIRHATLDQSKNKQIRAAVQSQFDKDKGKARLQTAHQDNLDTIDVNSPFPRPLPPASRRDNRLQRRRSQLQLEVREKVFSERPKVDSPEHFQCADKAHTNEAQEQSNQLEDAGLNAPDKKDELRRRRTEADDAIEAPITTSEDGEFDFAILLKPSKYEEHLEMPGNHSPTRRDSSSKRPSPTKRMSLVATSALNRSKKTKTNARKSIVDQIKKTGLQVKRLLSLDGKQSLLKVRAPQHILELGAERMRMRKRRQHDQSWMEFSCELRATFADYDAIRDEVHFIDSEKQSIVHMLLTSDNGGAGLNDFSSLKSKYVVQMFPLHKHNLEVLRRNWVTYWKSPFDFQSEIKDPISPTHSNKPPKLCCNIWPERLIRHVLYQPIDEVAQYYGEKVAFYFAWMEMYTRWLIAPSAVGILLFVYQVRSWSLDHPIAPLYAIFMALWTSAFQIAWKRRAAALAFRWGTLGYEDEEITRPEFYGTPVPGHGGEKHYPQWKRYLKYLVTFPCVLISVVVVMLIALAAFATRDRLQDASLHASTEEADRTKSSTFSQGLTLENLKRLSQLPLSSSFWFYFLITPMLYGLLIPLFDYLFTRFARMLTNWENHRTESMYRSHLILKDFSFRFVHVFASLYYYAFATPNSKVADVAGTKANEVSDESRLLRLAIQLASFMIAGQIWKNIMVTLFPFIRRQLQREKKKDETNKQFHRSPVFNPSHSIRSRRGNAELSRCSQRSTDVRFQHAVIQEQCVRLEQASDTAWEEAQLQSYDTFEDFTEMMIQFGYVTFFSLAFPLAPLLAFINNVVELRTDAFKLCHTRQRPIARRASGIGVWARVLEAMSVLAVLTNCLHIAFTTTQAEELLPANTPVAVKVWIVFAVEHLLLGLKVWMATVVPAMPVDVRRKLRQERETAKAESARAMAVKMQQAAATSKC